MILEIKQFCADHYAVTFPIMQKVDVNGENAHPLFDWLTRQRKNWLIESVKWNFEASCHVCTCTCVTGVETVVEPNYMVHDAY